MSKPIPLVVRTISRTALGTAWRAYDRAGSRAWEIPLVGVADRRNPRAIDWSRAMLFTDMHDWVFEQVEEAMDEEGLTRAAATREVLGRLRGDLVDIADYFSDLSFPLAVYRGILVPVGGVVRPQGESWTTNRTIAEMFATGSHDASEATHAGLGGRGRSVLLTGTIASPASVDWRQTLALFRGYSLGVLGDDRQAEEEIRIRAGSRVQDVHEIPLEGA